MTTVHFKPKPLHRPLHSRTKRMDTPDVDITACTMTDFLKIDTDIEVKSSDMLKPYNDGKASQDVALDMESMKSAYSSNISQICDDRVKSGESLFKMFLFEPSAHPDETEKCAAFWKYLRSREDIKPVQCELFGSSHEAVQKEKNVNAQVQTDCSIKTLRLTPENCPWTMAWEEINKIKERGLKTNISRKPFCKLCQDDAKGVDRSSSISISGTLSKEDLLVLNDWDVLAKHYADKEVEYPYDEIFQDKALDTCTSADILAGPQPGDKVFESRYKPKNLVLRPIGRRQNKIVNTDCSINANSVDSFDEEECLEEQCRLDKKRVSFFNTKAQARRTNSKFTPDNEHKTILKGQRAFSISSSKPTVQNKLTFSECVEAGNALSSSLESLNIKTTTTQTEASSEETILFDTGCLICGRRQCNCQLKDR